MIKVVAKKLCREESMEEILRLLGELVRETRKETGCILYEVFQDIKDKKIITIIEEWESEKDLENHSVSPHFTDLVPKIADLCGNKREINIYKKII